MTTDGAPSLTGTVNGFLAMCMRDDDFPYFLSYHCIIHQQALCCKILNMRHVMGICTKIVNSIRGRSLQRRMFRAQLEENEYDLRGIVISCCCPLAKYKYIFTKIQGPTTRGKRFFGIKRRNIHRTKR
ncbi:DUF4371 domain-containing protein [Trichonephila clavipes]|nr:DUF4371 domain-containing protein [Trichonephila clavipes]